MKKFQITYIHYLHGFKSETVQAENWEKAKQLAEQKGIYVDCTYLHNNTDLLFLH